MTFKAHLENLKFKLNRGNGLLAKIRYFVKADLLRTIYYALFDSHLRYGCQIWGQLNNQNIDTIKKTQNKALRIINFKGPLESATPLYKNSKVFKLEDTIKIDNCMFVFDQLKGNLPESFSNYFLHKSNQHQYNTRGNRLIVPHVKTTLYGTNSITLKAIKHWNEIQDNIEIDINSPETTRSKFLKAIKTYMINH